MIAIIIQSDYVVGTNSNVSADELDALGYEYLFVEELPDAIAQIQSGHRVRYVDGDFVTEALPSTRPSEIEILREENADLKARLADVELAIAEIFSGGVA